ncbi:2Fe-2S iron-sulfur cluster-binding protein [Methylobacterium oxalidis]|uniref:2Fe-2S iron-sulfur cluster-binding protein n=1 Tax=Methylobacterium oxalidis TaxID=944322 RepID=UPI003315C4DD
MPTLTIVTRTGREHTINARAGMSVMRNIRDAGLEELAAMCGGSCSCATCHVHVDPNWIETVGPCHVDEGDLLESSIHRSPSSRLACQITMTDALDGLHVVIAPED